MKKATVSITVRNVTSESTDDITPYDPDAAEPEDSFRIKVFRVTKKLSGQKPGQVDKI